MQVLQCKALLFLLTSFEVGGMLHPQSFITQTTPSVVGPTRKVLAWTTSSKVDKSILCLPVEQIPISNISLTEKERNLLPSLCWRMDLGPRPTHIQYSNDRGIPFGVKCNVTIW